MIINKIKFFPTSFLVLTHELGIYNKNIDLIYDKIYNLLININSQWKNTHILKKQITNFDKIKKTNKQKISLEFKKLLQK